MAHPDREYYKATIRLILHLQVKAGCEGTMATYGFPWPSMLDCDKFPLDNDMCIASMAGQSSESRGGGSPGAGGGGKSGGGSEGENREGGDREGKSDQLNLLACYWKAISA